MSAPFEKAIRELLPYADVVFDKFHVEKHLNESEDKRFAQANFTFWYEHVVKSGIRPMIKVANTLMRHLYGLLAWFGCMIDNALTEGFNSTIQSLKASARGYRNFENFRTVILAPCARGARFLV